MWSAPIHNKEFVGEMLEHVQEHASEFGTSSRIEGMLTIAKHVSRLVLAFHTNGANILLLIYRNSRPHSTSRQPASPASSIALRRL